MSGNGPTSDALKEQHAAAIAEGDTFKPPGVSEQATRACLNTEEGAKYWYRIAEAADPGTASPKIAERAVQQIQSDDELRGMETAAPGKPLLKFVAEGSHRTPHSPDDELIFHKGGIPTRTKKKWHFKDKALQQRTAMPPAKIKTVSSSADHQRPMSCRNCRVRRGLRCFRNEDASSARAPGLYTR